MRLLARLLAGLLLVATVVGTLVLIGVPATAGCAGSSPQDLLDTSDVAFSAAVTSRRETGGDLLTTVRVERVFKGDVTRRVDVVSPADEVDASMTDEPGGRLIVFGQLESDEVTSSLCTSVSEREVENYDTILADLGKGTEPSPGYMRAERRTFGLSYDQFVAGRAVLGVLGLSCLAVFAYRAWRGRRRTPG